MSFFFVFFLITDVSLTVIDVSGARGAGFNVVGCGGVVHGVRGGAWGAGCMGCGVSGPFGHTV